MEMKPVTGAQRRFFFMSCMIAPERLTPSIVHSTSHPGSPDNIKLLLELHLVVAPGGHPRELVVARREAGLRDAR